MNEFCVITARPHSAVSHNLDENSFYKNGNHQIIYVAYGKTSCSTLHLLLFKTKRNQFSMRQYENAFRCAIGTEIIRGS